MKPETVKENVTFKIGPVEWIVHDMLEESNLINIDRVKDRAVRLYADSQGLLNVARCEKGMTQEAHEFTFDWDTVERFKPDVKKVTISRTEWVSRYLAAAITEKFGPLEFAQQGKLRRVKVVGMY